MATGSDSDAGTHFSASASARSKDSSWWANTANKLSMAVDQSLSGTTISHAPPASNFSGTASTSPPGSYPLSASAQSASAQPGEDHRERLSLQPQWRLPTYRSGGLSTPGTPKSQASRSHELLHQGKDVALAPKVDPFMAKVSLGDYELRFSGQEARLQALERNMTSFMNEGFNAFRKELDLRLIEQSASTKFEVESLCMQICGSNAQADPVALRNQLASELHEVRDIVAESQGYGSGLREELHRELASARDALRKQLADELGEGQDTVRQQLANEIKDAMSDVEGRLSQMRGLQHVTIRQTSSEAPSNERDLTNLAESFSDIDRRCEERHDKLASSVYKALEATTSMLEAQIKAIGVNSKVDIESLQENLEEMKAKLNPLENSLRSQFDSLLGADTFENERSRVRDEMLALGTRIDSLESRVQSQLEGPTRLPSFEAPSVNDKIASISQNLQAVEARFQAQLANYNVTFASSAALATLRQSINAMEDSFRKQLDRHEADVSSCMDSRISVEGQLQRQQTEILEAKKYLQSFVEESLGIVEHKLKAVLSSSDSQATKEHLDATVASHQRTVENVESKVSSLSGRIDALKQCFTTLQASTEASEPRLISLIERVATNESQLNVKLHRQQEDLHSTVGGLRRGLDDLSSKIETCSQQISNLSQIPNDFKEAQVARSVEAEEQRQKLHTQDSNKGLEESEIDQSNKAAESQTLAQSRSEFRSAFQALKTQLENELENGLLTELRNECQALKTQLEGDLERGLLAQSNVQEDFARVLQDMKVQNQERSSSLQDAMLTEIASLRALIDGVQTTKLASLAEEQGEDDISEFPPLAQTGEFQDQANGEFAQLVTRLASVGSRCDDLGKRCERLTRELQAESTERQAKLSDISKMLHEGQDRNSQERNILRDALTQEIVAFHDRIVLEVRTLHKEESGAPKLKNDGTTSGGISRGEVMEQMKAAVEELGKNQKQEFERLQHALESSRENLRMGLFEAVRAAESELEMKLGQEVQRLTFKALNKNAQSVHLPGQSVQFPVGNDLVPSMFTASAHVQANGPASRSARSPSPAVQPPIPPRVGLSGGPMSSFYVKH